MIFFFCEKFGYVWSTHAEVPQEYKYSKSILYGYGSIFGVPVLHRTFTLNSIGPNLHKIVCEKRIEVKIEIEISKDKK